MTFKPQHHSVSREAVQAIYERSVETAEHLLKTTENGFSMFMTVCHVPHGQTMPTGILQVASEDLARIVKRPDAPARFAAMMRQALDPMSDNYDSMKKTLGGAPNVALQVFEGRYSTADDRETLLDGIFFLIQTDIGHFRACCPLAEDSDGERRLVVADLKPGHLLSGLEHIGMNDTVELINRIREKSKGEAA